jgi:hypothetical protein
MRRFLLSIWLFEAIICLSLVNRSYAASDGLKVVDEANQWMRKILSLEDSRSLQQGQGKRRLNRSLSAPTRACGEIIGRVTIDQVFQIADIIVDVLVPPGSVSTILVDGFKKVITDNMKYDFMVIKVCMSCSDVTPNMVGSQDAFDNSEEYGFASYCGSNSYASDAVRLGLAFCGGDVLLLNSCVYVFFNIIIIALQRPSLCSRE